jgi:hypothetical protein
VFAAIQPTPVSGGKFARCAGMSSMCSGKWPGLDHRLDHHRGVGHQAVFDLSRRMVRRFGSRAAD